MVDNMRNSTKCWSFSKNNGREKELVDCPVGVGGCTASWQELNGRLKEFTYQGCLRRHYSYNCSSDYCRTIRSARLSPSNYKENAKYASPTDDVTVKICCCTKDGCNDFVTSQNTRLGRKMRFMTSQTEMTSQIEISSLMPTRMTSFETSYPTWMNAVTYCVIITSLFAIFAYLLRKVLTSQTFQDKLCHHIRQNITLDEVKEDTTPLAESVTLESNLSEDNVVCDVIVDFEDVIGKGKFGIVYKAKGKNQNCALDLCFKIALDSADSRRCHDNEINIHEFLRMRCDDRIVTYYGTRIVDGKNGIILQYSTKDNLRNFLDQNTIGLKKCINMLCDVTSAVAFMHEMNYDGDKPRIAHRDICSSNFLVNQDLTLVLTDFGVSMVIDDVTGNTYAEHLTAEGAPYYVAPEVLDLSINLRHHGEALTQADVYSTSLVLWEIVTQCDDFYVKPPPHSLPYQHDVTTIHDLINHVVVRKKRPDFRFDLKSLGSRGTRDVITNTIIECWDSDEECRLSASCARDRMILLGKALDDVISDNLTGGDVTNNDVAIDDVVISIDDTVGLIETVV
ncbi:activin receptor type-2A-like [Ciona intestinalis]